MKHKIITLLICISILTAPAVVYSAGVVPEDENTLSMDTPFAPDQLIVKFRPEVRLDENGLTTKVASLDNNLSRVNAQGLSQLHGVDTVYKLKVSQGTDIRNAVEILNADPAVAYAEPDYLAQYASAPNDPRYDEQWGLTKVDVESAWSQTTGSSNVVIAVIDSGMKLDHEDLAPNQWVNPGEIPGNGLDDDNNGFIDDVNGWNFVDSTNNVQDSVGHGTAVTGIAAARSNNGLGIAGVCGDCQIMPVKVSQVSGFANYSDIASGVYYAVQKGARVINISLGGYSDSTTLKNALDYAHENNVVVIAGAGNDNTNDPFYPAAYADVISVAGTDPNDAKTSSSNYGSWVDLTAPGEDILSTTLGGYSTGSGTSYAAPFVSGAAGLLLSLHPDWTPALVRSQFMHTSDDITSQNPDFADLLGAGRLNIGSSIQDPEPILTYVGYIGNGIADLRPDFGSSVSLTVTVANTWADAVDVRGTLSSTDSFVTITDNSADFGTILAGESASNTSIFTFDIATGAGYNHSMPFSLVLTANNGAYQTTLSFQIQTRSSVENVSGTISSDTTWTSDKTYRVTNNLGVAPGYTLTIEPGTKVQFAGNFSLNIGGTLIAQGTASLPIVFEYETSGETWNQVFFDSPSQDAQLTAEGIYQAGNILQHVSLRGASGGIACDNATPYLSHVNTDLGGMSCSLGATNLWMVDTQVTGTVNITQGGAEPETLIRVTVSSGDASIPAASLVDSQFYGNLTISGVAEVQHITAKGLVQVGNNSTITDSMLHSGRISAGTGSTITRNNIENAKSTAIALNGTGTVTYNRVVGATNGIVVGGGTVENNLVAYTSSNGLEPGTASVRHNTLIGIEGHAVYLAQVPAAFEYNNFEFNTGDYDVYLTAPNSVQPNVAAQNNWWGTTDQDEIKERVYDFEQDYNLAKLITTLQLMEPSQTAPGYVRGVTLDPTSPVGIQTVDFMVEFSRPMMVDEDPLISFEATKGNTWSEKSSMLVRRSHFGVAAISDGRIYAINGYMDLNVPRIEAYDPLTDSWTSVAEMPTVRPSLGVAVASDGRIYAIGGLGFPGYSNIVEAYDPVTDMWTVVAPMPTPRHSLGVAAGSDGLIYAIGGETESGVTNIVEAYDPITDMWTEVAPMPTPRHKLGVAAGGDGRIYAIGGETESGWTNNVVEAYDPVTNTWTTVASMPTARCELGVAAGGDGRIYAIGGWTSGPINIVEVYNTLTDTWTTVAPMPTVRNGLGVAADSNGRVYAIGGSDHEFTVSNIVEVYTPVGRNTARIETSPQWLDDTLFLAQYDFTALNPRGDYRVLVSGLADPDGILIAPDNRTIFTVDYAGEIADQPAPSEPLVYASGFDTDASSVEAIWWSLGSGSTIAGYRYAIGSAPGSADIINWTDISTNTMERKNLGLVSGQEYWVAVQAVNTGGLWSEIGHSAFISGQSVELPTSPPTTIFLPILLK